jgi:hypothetical protein
MYITLMAVLCIKRIKANMMHYNFLQYEVSKVRKVLPLGFRYQLFSIYACIASWNLKMKSAKGFS